MKLQTKTLTGAALDWAVAKCEGFKPSATHIYSPNWPKGLDLEFYRPSTMWTTGGEIIERGKIRLDCAWSPGSWKGACKIDGVTAWTEGPTPLIAAMRCYVTSKLGSEIDVPAELCEVAK